MERFFKQLIRAFTEFISRIIDEEFKVVDEFCRPY